MDLQYTTKESEQHCCSLLTRKVTSFDIKLSIVIDFCQGCWHTTLAIVAIDYYSGFYSMPGELLQWILKTKKKEAGLQDDDLT